MPRTITARRLLTEKEEIDHPRITVEDGRILSLESGLPNDSDETLTAAFLDIHVHGAVSHDFMTANGAEIDSISRFLGSRGVAYYLPTTVTGPTDLTLRALETLADSIEKDSTDGFDAARPVAIHLEGPFVSHLRRGVHPVACLLEPSIALFDRFQHAARGHIRLMTIAPELPNSLEVMKHAIGQGVRVSMGHTDANEAEALAAIKVGAASATHAFNAMRPLNHREPGILGSVLDQDAVYAEAICDGIHVHPAMIRLWLRMKGDTRAILVTDGMSATGMPDGTYNLGDMTVEVKNGVCLAGETLAGSVLTMEQAVANLQRFTGSPLGTAVRLASHNPARMLGMPSLMSFEPGCPANFNVYDGEGRRTATILKGNRLPN
jgi:N-acetylglucosamine-6-phosphate deacetylase